MASPIPNTSMESLSVPSMPKLRYRTQSSDATNLASSDSISPVSPISTSFSLATVSTAPTSSGSSDLGSSPSLNKATLEIVSPPDVKSSTVPSSHSPSTLPKKNPKKRGGSFFGFFSVKEPSQQAFDDYQRQMRKKGASKNGQVGAIGLPGVSSAKLPPTVPKVNSRWDGIPQAVKEKEKQKRTNSSQSIDGRSRSIRTSGSEASTSTTTSSTRSRGSSLISKARDLQHHHVANPIDLYGWEAASGSSGNIPRNEYDEALKLLSITSSSKRQFIVSQAPPLPARLPSEYSKNTLAASGNRIATSSCSPSPTHSNATSSPTPSITSSRPAKSSNDGLNQSAKSAPRTPTIEIPDSEGIIIASNGLHILGPPAMVGRKGTESPGPAGIAEAMKIPENDASPDTSSSILPVSYSADSSGPLPAFSNDIYPDGWVARDANGKAVNIDGPVRGYLGADDLSPKINDGSEEQCRSLSTLDGGPKARKKSVMNFFSKRS
ncbi:hypothetical protein MMC07_004807 [Pseudocyphellaria aurata]|nr:hypothetical protein [Pseudocyphellaria aurata]